MSTKIGYLFPGQGSQFVGMGKSVFESYAVSKEIFEKANEILGYDLSRLCFEGPEDQLTQTKFSQPGIFVTSLAVLEALKKEVPDLRPFISFGLSLGEYTSLVALGSLTFEEGLNLVKLRAEAMEDASRATNGTMASVIGMEVEPCQAICDSVEGAQVANLNSPGQIVISGTKEGVAKASEICQEKGARKVIPLKVSGAFHSDLMAAASDRLEEAVQNANIQQPNHLFIPNFTANTEDDVANIKKYLLKQLTGTVRWSDSFSLAVKQGVQHFLEIGPGNVLKGLAKKIDKNAKVDTIEPVESIREIKEAFSVK